MLKKKNVIILICGIIVVWVASLLISKIMVDEKNPPQRYSGLILGNDADKIIKRVCFNCHSNETDWPWYTSMPVIYVLISSDVSEAREHLNFSDWDSINESKRNFYLKMVFNEIEHNEMPPFIYKLGHSEAKITQQDLKILKNRADSLGIPFNPKSKSD